MPEFKNRAEYEAWKTARIKGAEEKSHSTLIAVLPPETKAVPPHINIVEKKCKRCAMMIPDDAKICPYCRKDLRFMTIPVKIFLVFIAIGILPAFFIGKTDIKQHSEEDNMKVAYQVSQRFVSKYLKAPASADFPYYDESFVRIRAKEEKGIIFDVSAYVDAQNSFGAKLRTNFKCAVLYVPADIDKEWKSLGCNLDSR